MQLRQQPHAPPLPFNPKHKPNHPQQYIIVLTTSSVIERVSSQ
jgi:hypothetical protein